MPGGSPSKRKQEFGTREHVLQGGFDAAVEAVACPALPVKVHQHIDIGIFQRPPIGKTRQRGKDLSRAGLFFRWPSPACR